MCGLLGVFHIKSDPQFDSSQLRAGLAMLHKRGPDDQRLWTEDPKCQLAHSRLSILDLSDKAAQPMQDRSGRYHLAFNGEIYNHTTLRNELIESGNEFLSSSDTETLLYLLIEKGVDALSRLNGFFALAFYDAEEQSLLLARDQMGIKPMVYAIDEQAVYFASEESALMQFPIDREIDPISMNAYFMLNYIPAEQSIHKASKKLLPGSYLKIHKNGDLQIDGFVQTPETLPLAASSDSAKLAELLERSVSDRLLSDVPLGAFLSGGVDSSVIVALASEMKPGLKTFSIGFPDDPYYDESRFAEEVAAHCGTDHQSFQTRNDDLLHILDEVLEYLGEPFADSSALPVYILSRETRKQVTVALSGDGADELFAGYHKHEALWRSVEQAGMSSVLAMLEPLFRRLPRSRNGRFGNKFRQLHRFAVGANMPLGKRYLRWCKLTDDQELKQLLLNSEVERTNEWLEDRFAPNEQRGFNGILEADQKLILPNDMLCKVDLMSMANGLEVRVPFLDPRLVAFANSLPVEQKINARERKRILRSSFASRLPSSLFDRKKHGFEVPLLGWFRSELRSRMEQEWFADPLLREQALFDPAAVKALVRQLDGNNPAEAVARVWALIVFQNWWIRNQRSNA